jgi:hypothetical protein
MDNVVVPFGFDGRCFSVRRVLNLVEGFPKLVSEVITLCLKISKVWGAVESVASVDQLVEIPIGRGGHVETTVDADGSQFRRTSDDLEVIDETNDETNDTANDGTNDGTNDEANDETTDESNDVISGLNLDHPAPERPQTSTKALFLRYTNEH